MRKLNMEELHRISKEAYEKVGKLPVVIVLDNIRSLSNVGAVFRSADRGDLSMWYHSLPAASGNP